MLYLADVKAHPEKLEVINQRLHSDITGNVVQRAVEEAIWHTRARMFFRHTRECWNGLEDPGSTCICRPPAVEEPLT
jgi:hypothetical protein